MAQVDPQRLKDALCVAAQIVARDGERFLPVFLRLEAEVEAITGRNSAVERAKAMIGGEGRAA
ncbi:hypothetical protein [Falsiruegeria litorea]|uniref:hypothetical protein n=1 Tax=Falsiruegeria litorea TaxID=1280831 RepID=UPI001BFD3FCD|nr:hypothetical protein [Falsiruegeria litorea]MBT8169897.1 hypothetical protein [Falsiruegeria litorea]